jgi:hypothetical protein
MAETWRIHDDVPRGLAVTDAEGLEPERFAQLAKIVHEEAERYPPPFIERLPPLLLLRSARHDGEPIRARYFTPQRVAVVTPTLDLRGNLHRLVATDLLQTFPDRAQALLQACAAARSDLLYQGRLGVDGEAAALIAAVKSRRQSLYTLAQSRTGFGECLELAIEFLRDVDALHPLDADQREVGFLVTPDGAHPDYVLTPTTVGLRLAPPPANSSIAHTFISVDATEAPGIVSGIGRDLWIIPEVVLDDAIRTIFVVADVREPTCDIAGYASGTKGQPSDVVIESKNRRSILYHELGHALHTRFIERFPKEEWDAVVPSNEYFGDAREFAALGISMPNYHPTLLERGFATSYSSASFSEDVAELAEALFDGDARLWSSIPSAQLLARKVELMLTFLERVHPALTREYFQQLASVRHAQERMWSEA